MGRKLLKEALIYSCSTEPVEYMIFQQYKLKRLYKLNYSSPCGQVMVWPWQHCLLPDEGPIRGSLMVAHLTGLHFTFQYSRRMHTKQNITRTPCGILIELLTLSAIFRVILQM